MGMSNVPGSWGDDTPEPLVDLCTLNVVQNPETFCDHFIEEGYWTLKEGLTLPQEICERLINVWQDIGPERLDDEFVGLFKDLSSTRLKRVVLRKSYISDNGLKTLLSHKLTELDISKCKNLTTTSVGNINEFGNHLLSITLCKSILKKTVASNIDSNALQLLVVLPQDGCVLKTPNLRKLVLHDFTVPNYVQFFSFLVQPLSKLNYLDLSGCHPLEDLSYLENLNQLKALILHSVLNLHKSVPTLCKLKSLR